ncbi:histidinol dehydrogenase [Ileibacterium valens]|uniref:histidinol dehydrogenase n=1 Tax=Ileibacterium valens TaxID=1862668 RepID=UPI00272B8328|nr:histidinol dehydrogenase [Ileibacterium valens]
MLSAIDKTQKEELAAYLQNRSQEISTDILAKAAAIIDEVRKDKDNALKKYTELFDQVSLDDFEVSKEELEEAASKADADFVAALEDASKNIYEYHEAQKKEGYRIERSNGAFLGQRIMPLASAGIYVPGGRAQYPSSVLMNAIPAKVAGVREIIMVTPPSKSGSIMPNIAAAAKVAGITRIFKVGGAQAIAALAYGTQSIPAVDKIVGPGNIFVAAAKKLVFGKTDIDMIAGPSEILVIADENANPAYAAADLLSQAEHDPMASAILISNSKKMIDAVNKELRIQTDRLPKKAIIEESLKNYGKSILTDTLEEAVDISNAIAPEHLELLVEDPMALLDQVKNAGSVFLGYYTCESVGDYFGGTNHVLPTSGTARFSSPLGVDSFVKKSSYLYYPKEVLLDEGKRIINLAEHEDLDAHANAVSVRLNNEN